MTEPKFKIGDRVWVDTPAVLFVGYIYSVQSSPKGVSYKVTCNAFESFTELKGFELVGFDESQLTKIETE